MIDLAPHRRWLIVLGAAVGLFVIGLPLLDSAEDHIKQQADDVSAQRMAAERNLQYLHDDIATARTAKPKQEDMENLLAPVDRLQAMTVLERSATSFGLQHFAYTLSPEHKIEENTLSLASSHLTFAADAATDSDVYGFIDAARRSLPGRVKITQLTVERLGDFSQPLTETNIHMTAVVEWLSNGAVKSQAHSGAEP